MNANELAPAIGATSATPGSVVMGDVAGSDQKTAGATSIAPIDMRREAIRGEALRRGLTLATVAWLFGSVWLSATTGTAVTNYARQLGASKFQFGLIAAMPFLASLLTLPASLLTEATGKRKQIFLYALYTQRTLWFVIALAPLALVRHFGAASAEVAMVLFLVLFFFMHAGQAVGSPGYLSWMADLVPDRIRGTYFSRRRAAGMLTAIPAAFVVGWVLDRYSLSGAGAMMTWCAVIMIGAAVFGLIDIHLFQYVPDVPHPPRKGRHLFRAMREPLKNKRFMWFAGFVATLTFAVSFMTQFVTLYVIERLAVGAEARPFINRTAQLIVVVAPNLGMLLVLGLWGRVVDRMGKKPLLKITAVLLVPVAVGWCFLKPGDVWMAFVLSALGGLLWSGVEVANLNLTLEFSGRADDSTGGSAYAAMNTLIINLAGCCGGLVAGAIAQTLRDWTWVTAVKTFTLYDVLFALSALLRLVAVVVFLPHIQEPDARPTWEAVKFVTASIRGRALALTRA